MLFRQMSTILPKEADRSLDEIIRRKPIEQNIALLEMRRRKKLTAFDPDYLNFELDQIVQSRKESSGEYVNSSLEEYMKDAAVSAGSSARQSPVESKFNRKSMRDLDSDEEEDEILDLDLNDDVHMEDVNVKQEPDDNEEETCRRFVTIEAANKVKMHSQQWRLRSENLSKKEGIPGLSFAPLGPTNRLRHPGKRSNGRIGSRWSDQRNTGITLNRKPVTNIIQGAELHGNFVEKGNLTFKFTGTESNDTADRIIAIDRKIRGARPGPRPLFTNRVKFSDPPVAPAPIHITNNYYINESKKTSDVAPDTDCRAEADIVLESMKQAESALTQEQKLKRSFSYYLSLMKRQDEAIQNP